MKPFKLDPPLNVVAKEQPIIPDIRPDLHLNILIASMTIGGAERCVHDLLTGLSKRSPTGKLFIMHEVIPSYPLTDSERFRVFRLGRLDRQHKLDTVTAEVLTSPMPVIYTHLIRAADLRHLWRMGIMTIPVIHNSEPGWHDSPESYDHPQVPFIVAVSESVADQLRAKGLPKPVVVIRHELQRWVSPEEHLKNRERIRQQYGISKGTLLIGMVGQFKAHKAYTRAVRVLHRVQQFHQARLMILGGWNHNYGSGRVAYTAACRKALELGVLPDMIIPGSIHPVEPYFSAFDIFLNTSIYEGLSIATLEAIQSGCPVVTADVGGQREALPPDAVLIEDPSDIAAYAEAIRRLSRKRERTVVAPPPSWDLVPRLWGLTAKYGPPRLKAPSIQRAHTLFLTSNLNPGGAQRSLTNLLSNLPSDHRVLLCVLGKVLDGYFLRSLEQAGVPTLALDSASGMLDRVERILDLLDKLGAENLCFWNVDPNLKLLLTKILELRATRIIDVSPGPMLFQELEQTDIFQKRICFTADQYFRRLDKFVVKYSDALLSSPYPCSSDKVSVIPNGVPLPLEANSEQPEKILLPASADPELAIVTCCRIVPNKRLEWLIDMMSILTTRVPGATLTIVGGVDQRHIPYWNSVVEKLEEAGLGNIHFAGSHADVFSFLDQFKIFVMISYAQGCPNASLEAMAMARPVVANSDGGTAEQIEHGLNGFLVSGKEPAEMAEYVEFLLKNQEIAQAFGEAGQKIARQKFSLKRMVNSYLRLLATGGEDDQSLSEVFSTVSA
jgi:glycosyltransferase involved in cell wall biosynthesis